MTITAADGTRLDAVLVTPSSPLVGTVVLVHGITGDKEEHGKYERLADDLKSHNLASLRFSFRGHGRSEKGQLGVSIGGEISDLFAALTFARTVRTPVSVVAYSFGAVSTLSIAMTTSLIERLVLWSPVLDLRDTFLEPTSEWGRQYYGRRLISEAMNDGYLNVHGDFKLPAPLFVEMENYNMKPAVQALTVPTLVIHGTDDECVSFDIAKRAAASNANVTFLAAIGSDHGFDDPEVDDFFRSNSVRFIS